MSGFLQEVFPKTYAKNFGNIPMIYTMMLFVRRAIYRNGWKYPWSDWNTLDYKELAKDLKKQGSIEKLRRRTWKERNGNFQMV